MLTKEKILSILRLYKSQHAQKYGIDEIGLFGSYARESADEESDVDIFVKLQRSNLLLLSRIRIDLEEKIGKHVDIVEVRNRMNMYLKKHIEEEAVVA
jgi:predicted nucleotidyltransferase